MNISVESTEWLLLHCFQMELKLEMLVFEEGGKPEYPEKNPRSRDSFLDSFGNLPGPKSVFDDKCFSTKVNFC